MIFFLPETIYDRPKALETDRGAAAADAAIYEAEHKDGEKGSETRVEDTESANKGDYLPAKTLAQEMKPWVSFRRSHVDWPTLTLTRFYRADTPVRTARTARNV